jgi:phosphoribosylglycinamide formyltransferase-1
LRLKKLGILLSGRGSNFLAIHRAIAAGELTGAEIALVLSNNAAAPGLEAARELGLRTGVAAAKKLGERDAQLLAALREAEVDLVCLAGYMRLISPAFVAAFPQRILNVHPSLLPAFPGLDAQVQALEFGAKVAGCTVHFVDEEMDHGVILLQRAVPVHDDDTAETLSARILVEEHLAYPEAVRRVLSGDYGIEGRRYVRQK